MAHKSTNKSDIQFSKGPRWRITFCLLTVNFMTYSYDIQFFAMIKNKTILFPAFILGVSCFLTSVSPVLYASGYTADLLLPDYSDGYGQISDLISVEIGKIDCEQKYAWGENTGWIDFNPEWGGLKIGSNVLAGRIFIKKLGWVYLGDGGPRDGYQYSNDDRRDYGVNNDGEGNLTGWGWGENVGWINFDGVGINREGIFSGSADSTKVGLIIFDCAGPVTFLVKTDPYPWRKIGWSGEIKSGRASRSSNEDETLSMGCSGPAFTNSPQSSFSAFYLCRSRKILNDKLIKKTDLNEDTIVFRIEVGECNERAPPKREKNIQKFENRSCSTELIFKEATSRKAFYNLAIL